MTTPLPLLGASICRWPRDAEAAAALMVDDLTDGWIDRDGTGRPTGPNDWGHALDGLGSAVAFLRDGLLREHPEVRTTFFVPVARVEDVRPASYATVFRPIDERPEFADFLRRLQADPRFECAYHGLEHGRPGPEAADYEPEFGGYRSQEEAAAGLEAGRAVWRRVFGQDPEGGKYPAYTSGPHGDAAVDAAGFSWWCRRFDGSGALDDALGCSSRWFGARGVLDVPSTVHGGALSQPPLPSWRPKAVASRAILTVLARVRLRARLDALLAGRHVITVQEHITWTRPDSARQTPNLRDDVPTLRAIFGALRSRDVWHATCGDIARYIEARERTEVRAQGGSALLVEHRGRQVAPCVSLALLAPGVEARTVALSGPGGAQIEVAVARRRGDSLITEPASLAPGIWQVARG